MTEKRVYNRIKAVLAEQGKTNLWLAEALNKNKTTVSKWCTNDVQPPMETLFEIADVLKVDVKELLVSNIIYDGITKKDGMSKRSGGPKQDGV
jgi:putative transcriptional regulator